MDEIVRGLFKSNQSQNVKRQIFKKLRVSFASSIKNLTSQKQFNLLHICMKYFLTGNDFDSEEAALLLQDIVPLLSSECYEMLSSKFFEKTVLGDFVPTQFSDVDSTASPTKVIISRRINLIEILLEEFKRQKLKKLIIYIQVCIKTEAIRLLYESLDHRTFSQICSFLTRFDDCMPPASRRFAMCTICIRAMSDLYPIDKDIKALTTYIADIGEISSLVDYIWSKEPATLLPSLNEVFNMISSNRKDDTEPSNALGCLVRYIPVNVIKDAVAQTVNEPSISDQAMTVALTRMVAWLGWPNAMQANMWILAFLEQLSNAAKYSILVEVTLKTIKQVFNCLRFPMSRVAALPVLIHMLMCHQEAPDAFHIIVPLIPGMVVLLEKENKSEENLVHLKQIANLCHCMIELHGGFPELYSPILEAIKKYPVPSLGDIRNALTYSTWFPRQQHVVRESHVTLRRHECGKAGLQNLGNTCYINSVIQALFMIPEFRRAILDRSFPSQSVSAALAKTFAFLTLTDRVSYEPVELVERSRPTWFEPGGQQDCTEYLKHLLERLQTEEKQTKPTKSGNGEGSAIHDPQSTNTSGTTVSKDSAVEKLFHGKITSEILCKSCNSVSSREEDFVDFPLPLSQTGGQERSGETSSDISYAPVASDTLDASSPAFLDEPSTPVPEQGEPAFRRSHQLDDLIHQSLADELMSGENQYRCSNCLSLQDAVKSTRLTSLPPHLILTLMRFTYDATLQRRSKILDHVEISEEVRIPFRKDGADTNVLYNLHSVVIHSGTSTDSGHYYCFAKQARSWFLFNDSHVSLSNFSDISQLSSKFSRDTSYVLVFARHDAVMTIDDEEAKGFVSQTLCNVIAQDNRLFQQELEEASRRQSKSPARNNVLGWGDDNNPPPPPSFGGGDGPPTASKLVY